ncbi:protein prenylyltransferase [Amylocystis lapponica]|nr:protein prenylyltransferase [Amylocystis lapponica]
MSAVFDDEPDVDDVLYADRPEWADIVPVPQYEGVNPLAPIFYSAEYKDATDYFRGIVKAGEMSPRVLELTERIIRMNPAHYSAWQYRYRTLLALDAPLEDELRRMDAFALDFLKTYQVWHHRRLLLAALRAPRAAAAELAFVARALERDAKNYHTWSYRQWLLAHFDAPALWAGERAWVEGLLAHDVRNNSAWHHRFFVLAFAREKIALAPGNASAWNYLRGVLEHTQTPFAALAPFVRLYTAPTLPVPGDVLDLENPPPAAGAQLPSVHALEFSADMYEREGGAEMGKAVEIWRALADEHDTTRKKYWEFRIKEALQAS